MQLDFLTLYVVILLNSLTLSIIWASICYAYRSFRTARYWLASTALTTIGGAILALEGFGFGLLSTVAGNALVVLGFCLTWTGVRHFHGRPPRWTAIGLIMLASISAMALVGDGRPAQNVTYAVSQFIPIALTMGFLLRREHRSLGALVAIGATGLALLGHGAETTLNVLRLTGDLSTADYYAVAAYALLAVIFGGGVWNIGFILMAFDRLRAELEALAIQDDLTGLPNRRSLMDTARRYEALGEHARVGFSVLVIDLDGFKATNDRYGHAAGDACLKHFAALTSQFLREEDTFARLSGDEFCILLPEIDLPEAATTAGDLIDHIADTPCQWKRRSIPMAISIGIAEWWPEPGTSIAKVLEDADAALYRAKRRGGNGYSLPGEAEPEGMRTRPSVTLVK